MRRLTEGERCAGADGRTGRNSTVLRWHDTVDHWLLVLLLAVEAPTLHVRTQGAKGVPVLWVMVVGRHVLITHTSDCWRL